MAAAVKHLCAAPGCRGIVSAGVCSQCGPRARLADSRRGSATSRGYGRRWQRRRKAFLRSHPLCADCLEEQTVRGAIEVHHLDKVAPRRSARTRRPAALSVPRTTRAAPRGQ